MGVQSYQDLVVWQQAMDLVVQVYQATRSWPAEERFGLTNQVRRAAVSIRSNIAEGQGRGVGSEFAHHVRIAQGSLQEMETQLILGQRLNYFSGQVCDPLMFLASEVGRLNRGLHKSIV